ncbi:beta-N-acetylglucosaminidase [Clostridium botulinum A str. Hall]|uniref:glucosaminidase domain-containing protein n=1 Tax=Clostridium botulinum TaxID=1491 RepID=UPI00015925A0|nr:glucosaminidase domain-containing protein [Clostridium botulinum]ABS37089.1 beta-N-acetylglucosaminidase [Clostridium botulinum A str. Hall]
MRNKKYNLMPKIISLFFILFLFSIRVQAISNISIDLKTPIHKGIINDKKLNIDGEIKSILKLKSIYLYIDNKKIGQANLNELEFKENTYKTRLKYTKDISSLKNGIHNLRILAIDEQNNKKEKEISINIQENQEKSETDKNIIQNNLVDTNVKMGNIEKALTTVSNEAKLEKVEVLYNGNVITNGEIGVGKSYVIKGYGNSENGVLYQFWVKDLSTNSWTMIRDYGETNSFNYTPTKAGKYLIGIHVKDKYSKENLDDFIYENYTVTVSKAKLEKVEVSYDGNVITNGEIGVGKSYVIKGYGNSENGVLYQFWVKDLSTNSWTMIRDYGETNSFNYTPTKAGKYLIGIHVKDKYSKENLDDFIYENYTVTVSKAKLEKVEVSYDGNVITNGEIGVGKSYVIKGYGNSENGVLYQFWVKDLSTNSWTMIRDYGETNSFNYTPAKAGKYLIGIHVKDKYSKENLDDFIYENYDVSISKAKLEKVEVSYNGNVITNGEIGVEKNYVIKGYGNSENGVLYQFWVKDLSTNSWTMIRDYGETNSFNYTPAKAGKYLIGIHVKDKYSKENLDDFIYENYDVSISKAKLEKVEVSYNGNAITNSEIETGKNYTIKGYGNSKNEILYQFWVKDLYTNSWTMIKDYGEENSINWQPTIGGKYLIGIHVKDKYSADTLDDHIYENYTILSDKARLEKVEVKLDGNLTSNDLNIGKTYTIEGNAISKNGVLYQFWVKDLSINSWAMLRDYGESNNIAYTPTKGGKYLIGIHVKDKNSKESLDDFKYVEYNVIGSNTNYKETNYNITLDEIVNKQMENRPAYHTYIPEKNTYEWRYAIIKNGKKGYSTDINGVNWVQSDQQYDYIKSKVKEYMNPTNQIYDPIGQYQFLQLSYYECTTAQQLNSALKGKGVLEGKGQAFIDAGKESNVSPIYLVAHALLETGNGTSTLAKGVVVNGKTVYNLFGIGAVDSDPIGQGSKYAYEQGWFSVDLAIKGGAKWISAGYINNATYKQDTLYKMRWNPSNPTVHQYATDVMWAYNQVGNIKKVIDQLQSVVFNFDVPVYK